MVDNLSTSMCRLSEYLGASNFWNPQGLSGPVMGLLYLLYEQKILMDKHIGISGTSTVRKRAACDQLDCFGNPRIVPK
jgi:hypothetical protein